MPVILASPALSAVINLAQVTFTLDLPTAPDSGSGNFNAQVFLLRKSDGGYEAITPRNTDYSPVRIAIFGNGVRNTASFTVLMKPDEYTTGQVVLFAEGTNFTDPSPVSFPVAVDIIVTSTHIRLTKPTFEIDPVIVGADGKITVPYVIRYPSDVTLFNAADNNVLPWGGFIGIQSLTVIVPVIVAVIMSGRLGHAENQFLTVIARAQFERKIGKPAARREPANMQTDCSRSIDRRARHRRFHLSADHHPHQLVVVEHGDRSRGDVPAVAQHRHRLAQLEDFFEPV